MLTPQAVRNVYISWKSTLTGLLSLAIEVTLAVTLLPPKTKRAVVVVSVLRAAVNCMKKDAGVVEAAVPGVDGVVTVPSHETPDSPDAVPVKARVQ